MGLVALLLLACGAPQPAPPVGPPSWVGSSTCAPCHADETAAHGVSNHAFAERMATGTGAFEARGAPELPEGPARIIGRDPLWQPIVAAERGRLQAHNMAWHPSTQSWFDIFEDTREPGDWGHWTGRGMTWNTQCAHCHNTAVAPGFDIATDTYTTTMVETGVGCESCHGPGSIHARTPATPMPAKASESCEPCHTRGTPLQTFDPTLHPLDQIIPATIGLGEDWYPDGSVATESFEGVAFRASHMHSVGVTCTNCHGAHAPDADDADTACATCHAATPEHSHHESVGCVDCHMPIKTFMQRHPRHDHGFHIPDPELERELDLPSACDRCHEADTVGAQSWWTGAEPRRRRARALHQARQGDGSRLDGAYKAEVQTSWRASLLTASAPFPDVLVEARRTAAVDVDPWLRLAAARSLRPSEDASELRRLATDSRLAVRVEAQRRLQPFMRPSDPLVADLVSHLQLLGDSPIAAAELGAWWAAAGAAPEALPHLRRAIQLDPRHIDARRNLAVVLAGMGRGDLALQEIDAAVAIAPDQADLHFLRALALEGTEGTRSALERVLALDPTHSRARYNFAVLLHQNGQLDEAVVQLQQLGDHADGLAFLASIELERGNRDQARAAAERAVSLQPSQALARDVLGRLNARTGRP